MTKTARSFVPVENAVVGPARLRRRKDNISRRTDLGAVENDDSTVDTLGSSSVNRERPRLGFLRGLSRRLKTPVKSVPIVTSKVDEDSDSSEESQAPSICSDDVYLEEATEDEELAVEEVTPNGGPCVENTTSNDDECLKKPAPCDDVSCPSSVTADSSFEDPCYTSDAKPLESEEMYVGQSTEREMEDQAKSKPEVTVHSEASVPSKCELVAPTVIPTKKPLVGVVEGETKPILPTGDKRSTGWNAEAWLSGEGASTRNEHPQRQNSKKIQWTNERNYWNKIVLKRSVRYGTSHLRTAEALMNLGHAQMACEESLEAGKSYLSALKIYQVSYGDYHLTVARALDRLGLAACKTHENLDLAMAALTDALKIRCELLGSTHVDAVDTLNNIAGVRLNMAQAELAALDYLAVFRNRVIIFGRNHASVAITCYTLACILSDRLGMAAEGNELFLVSLRIYEALGLRDSQFATKIRERIQMKTSLRTLDEREQKAMFDGLQGKLRSLLVL